MDYATLTADQFATLDADAWAGLALDYVDTTPPVTPTNFTVKAGDGHALIQFTASTDDTANYVVTRNGVELTDLILEPDDDDNLYGVDRFLTNGTTYTYAVYAFDGAGNQSAATAGVAVTPGKIVLPVIDPTEQTIGVCYTYDGRGELVGNVAVQFTLISKYELGHSFDATAFTATSDTNGLLQVELLRDAQYQAQRGSGKPRTFRTGKDSTYEIPTVIGSA